MCMKTNHREHVDEWLTIKELVIALQKHDKADTELLEKVGQLVDDT